MKLLFGSVPFQNGDAKIMHLYIIFIFSFSFFPLSAQKDKKTSEVEFLNVPSGEFVFDNSYHYRFQNGLKCPVKDDRCRIKVKIAGFSISRKPVTRKQWESVFGNIKFSPWEKNDLPLCPDCAASGFSHDETLDFLKAFSKKDTGREDSYRLPSESEMIYLLSSCAGKCGEIRSTGMQLQFSTEDPYQNRFGFTVQKDIQNAYFWTEDYASDSYLQELLSAGQIPPYSDPRPKPLARFDYGRIMLSYSLTPEVFQISRMGYSKSMVPSEKETAMYIIRKGNRK